MNTNGTNIPKKAALGGLLLFIVGFVIAEHLPYLDIFLSRGVWVLPYSEITGRNWGVSMAINILVKLLILWLYTRWALRCNFFHVKFGFNKRTAIIGAGIVAFFLLLSIFASVKPTIHKTWNGLNNYYGPTYATINTILLYVYYVFEGLIIIWMVDTFQTAGERSFNNSKVLLGWDSAYVDLGSVSHLLKGPVNIPLLGATFRDTNWRFLLIE